MRKTQSSTLLTSSPVIYRYIYQVKRSAVSRYIIYLENDMAPFDWVANYKKILFITRQSVLYETCYLPRSRLTPTWVTHTKTKSCRSIRDPDIRSAIANRQSLTCDGKMFDIRWCFDDNAQRAAFFCPALAIWRLQSKLVRAIEETGLITPLGRFLRDRGHRGEIINWLLVSVREAKNLRNEVCLVHETHQGGDSKHEKNP